MVFSVEDVAAVSEARADLLIGAWQSREGAPSGGKCYLYSGASGKLVTAWDLRAAT